MSFTSVSARLRRVGFPIAVIGILLLGLALRCHALGARSLWTDECLSMECSSGWGRSDLRVADSNRPAPDLIGLDHARPWTSIWGSIAADENHPPLYFILLRGWREAFGDSATAMRAMSVLASLLAVGLMIAAGTEAFGRGAGLSAGLLMAVATPQLSESQDARAYMLVTALAVAALLALLRIERRGANAARLAGLFVALLLMPLLHYMALVSVGAAILYAAIGMRGRARWATASTALGAALAYAALWGPHMVGQHQRMLDATQWLSDPGDGGWRVALDLLAAPVRLLVLASPAAVAVGGLAVLLAPPLALLVARRSPALAGSRGDLHKLLLPWLWMALPIAVAATIDVSNGRHSLSVPKYTLAGAPGLYLLLGATASVRRWRLAWVPAAVIALACLAFLPDVYHPDEPDWRELAQAAAGRTGVVDPLVLVAQPKPGMSEDETCGMRVVCLEYGLKAVGDVHRNIYVVDGPPAGATLAALSHARHACVLRSGLDPVNQMLGGLVTQGSEMFVGMGILTTADRPTPPPRTERVRSAMRTASILWTPGGDPACDRDGANH